MHPKVISLSGQTHTIQAQKTLVPSENATPTICKGEIPCPGVSVDALPVARDRNPSSKDLSTKGIHWLSKLKVPGVSSASGTAGFRAQMVSLELKFFLFWVLSSTKLTSILGSTWWQDCFLPFRIPSSASSLAGKSERFSSGSPSKHFIVSLVF